jgi:hypothetical protein
LGDPRLDGKILLKWILGKKFEDRAILFIIGYFVMKSVGVLNFSIKTARYGIR